MGIPETEALRLLGIETSHVASNRCLAEEAEHDRRAAEWADMINAPGEEGN